MDPLSIARALREVSQYLQLKGEDFYKSRAYDFGADRMAGFSGFPGAFEAYAECLAEPAAFLGFR